nr:hypothetical protein [Tanacetum cinerariifolium]
GEPGQPDRSRASSGAVIACGQQTAEPTGGAPGRAVAPAHHPTSVADPGRDVVPGRRAADPASAGRTRECAR